MSGLGTSRLQASRKPKPDYFSLRSNDSVANIELHETDELPPHKWKYSFA